MRIPRQNCLSIAIETDYDGIRVLIGQRKGWTAETTGNGSYVTCRSRLHLFLLLDCECQNLRQSSHNDAMKLIGVS